MREIKFRAWDKDNKGWLIDISQWTVQDLNNSGSLPGDNFTIMQYTGLKDKNGKEIYEGDIVDIGLWNGTDSIELERGVINWNEKSSAFKWFSVEDDPSDENNYWLTQSDETYREVIGNIWENGDLLND